MITKYDFEIQNEVYQSDINRLTNQIWKLIPMKEKSEDWLSQLNTVLVEIAGLHELLCGELDFLVLMSKLEGLRAIEEFTVYRKTVFEAISLLRGLSTYGT